MELTREQRIPTGVPLSTPLIIGFGQLPKPKKDNRWNKELRRAIERGLNFSGLKWYSLTTSVSPNNDTLAPVRTYTWCFFAKGLYEPFLRNWTTQKGPISFLPVLQSIQKDLARLGASRQVRIRFWLYRLWVWLATEVQ